jgi:hypothetical protein
MTCYPTISLMHTCSLFFSFLHAVCEAHEGPRKTNFWAVSSHTGYCCCLAICSSDDNEWSLSACNFERKDALSNWLVQHHWHITLVIPWEPRSLFQQVSFASHLSRGICRYTTVACQWLHDACLLSCSHAKQNRAAWQIGEILSWGYHEFPTPCLSSLFVLIIQQYHSFIVVSGFLHIGVFFSAFSICTAFF